MKSRHNFVSNSSSSNFIVAVKSGNYPDTIVRIVRTTNITKYGHKITNVAEFEEFFRREYPQFYEYKTQKASKLDDYEQKEFSELKDIFNKSMAALKADKIIIAGEFSSQNGDDYDEIDLCEEGIDVEGNPHIEVIDNEAGY